MQARLRHRGIPQAQGYAAKGVNDSCITECASLGSRFLGNNVATLPQWWAETEIQPGDRRCRMKRVFLKGYLSTVACPSRGKSLQSLKPGGLVLAPLGGGGVRGHAGGWGTDPVQKFGLGLGKTLGIVHSTIV